MLCMIVFCLHPCRDFSFAVRAVISVLHTEGGTLPRAFKFCVLCPSPFSLFSVVRTAERMLPDELNLFVKKIMIILYHTIAAGMRCRFICILCLFSRAGVVLSLLVH